MAGSRIRGPTCSTRLCLDTRPRGSEPEPRHRQGSPASGSPAAEGRIQPRSKPLSRPGRPIVQSGAGDSLRFGRSLYPVAIDRSALRKFDRCVYRRATVSYRRNRDRVVFQQYGGAIGASRAEAMPDASSGAVEERSGAVTRKQNGAYRGDVRPRAAPPPRTGPALLLCPEISISVNRTSGETNGYDHGLDGSR